MDAVRTLKVDATGVPDMRKSQKTVIDQHSMWAAEQHTR